MSNIANRINRIAYIIPLFIVYMTVMQLQLLTPFISLALLFVLMMILLFVIDRKITSYPFFAWWLFFSAIVLLNGFMGDAYFSDIISSISFIFYVAFSAITLGYCVNRRESKLERAILISFFIAVVYLTICTVIIDLSQPGVLRSATGLSFRGDPSLLSVLFLQGMSNYFLPHALPMLIPPLVMGIKNRELSKSLHFFLYVCLAAILALIYVSYATTPLIIAILFLILSIIVKAGNIRRNIGKLIIVILLFAPFILNTDLMLSFLQQVDTVTGGEGELHNKIGLFQETLVTGKTTGDLEERFDLYNESASFLQSNWILGTNDKVGGHSVILDTLASLGLIGFIPFILMIFKQIKYSLLFLPKSSYIYYYMGTAAGLLMFFSKGINTWEMWLVLFCIVPLLTLRLSKSK